MGDLLYIACGVLLIRQIECRRRICLSGPYFIFGLYISGGNGERLQAACRAFKIKHLIQFQWRIVVQ